MGSSESKTSDFKVVPKVTKDDESLTRVVINYTQSKIVCAELKGGKKITV